MAGLQMWTYKDSINQRLSTVCRPWAVAGMQPEDYSHPDDEQMAKILAVGRAARGQRLPDRGFHRGRG